ncbi:MAG: MFS transporter, partial [Aggregatilineales bacterium]
MLQRLKSADRRLLTILMIVFVQIVGASMALPVLPLYAQRRFDMSPQLITLLVSSFFAAQFVAGPYIGRLSDRYGRIPILIISQIGTVISFLMLAYGQSIAILFFARIFDGITGGNIVVAQAYVTDITPREKRTQSLGLIFAALGVGFIFGPAIGGILSAAFNEQAPFLVAAVAATITVILTWFTLDETVSPEQREFNRTSRKATLSFMDVASNMPLLLVLFVAFMWQLGLGILQGTFALYG